MMWNLTEHLNNTMVAKRTVGILYLPLPAISFLCFEPALPPPKLVRRASEPAFATIESETRAGITCEPPAQLEESQSHALINQIADGPHPPEISNVCRRHLRWWRASRMTVPRTRRASPVLTVGASILQECSLASRELEPLSGDDCPYAVRARSYSRSEALATQRRASPPPGSPPAGGGATGRLARHLLPPRTDRQRRRTSLGHRGSIADGCCGA